MRHANLPLDQRAVLALERIKAGQAPMRIPVEATDPDIVISDLRSRVLALEDLLRRYRGLLDVALRGNAIAAEAKQLRADLDAALEGGGA